MDDFNLNELLSYSRKTKPTVRSPQKRLTNEEIDALVPPLTYEPPAIILPHKGDDNGPFLLPNDKPTGHYSLPPVTKYLPAHFSGHAVPIDNVRLGPLTNGRIEHWMREGKYGERNKIAALIRQQRKTARKDKKNATPSSTVQKDATVREFFKLFDL